MARTTLRVEIPRHDAATSMSLGPGSAVHSELLTPNTRVLRALSEGRNFDQAVEFDLPLANDMRELLRAVAAGSLDDAAQILERSPHACTVRPVGGLTRATYEVEAGVSASSERVPGSAARLAHARPPLDRPPTSGGARPEQGWLPYRLNENAAAMEHVEFSIEQLVFPDVIEIFASADVTSAIRALAVSDQAGVWVDVWRASAAASSAPSAPASATERFAPRLLSIGFAVQRFRVLVDGRMLAAAAAAASGTSDSSGISAILVHGSIPTIDEGVGLPFVAWQQSPLMLAAKSGDADMVALLLHYGADPCQKSVYGLTALDWAVSNAPTAQGSVEAAASAAEHAAAAAGVPSIEVPLMQMTLSPRARLPASPRVARRTAGAFYDAVLALLAHSDLACALQDRRVVERDESASNDNLWLLKQDPLFLTEEQRELQRAAAATLSPALAAEILAYRAMVRARAMRPLTPRSSREHKPRPGRVFAQTALGETALHMAARNGNMPVLRLLVSSGLLDLSLQDASGHTAMQIALVQFSHAATATTSSPAEALDTALYASPGVPGPNVTSAQVLELLLDAANRLAAANAQQAADGTARATPPPLPTWSQALSAHATPLLAGAPGAHAWTPDELRELTTRAIRANAADVLAVLFSRRSMAALVTAAFAERELELAQAALSATQTGNTAVLRLLASLRGPLSEALFFGRPTAPQHGGDLFVKAAAATAAAAAGATPTSAAATPQLGQSGTPLHAAARAGSAALVRLYLALPCGPRWMDATDASGVYACHACQNADVVEAFAKSRVAIERTGVIPAPSLFNERSVDWPCSICFMPPPPGSGFAHACECGACMCDGCVTHLSKTAIFAGELPRCCSEECEILLPMSVLRQVLSTAEVLTVTAIALNKNIAIDSTYAMICPICERKNDIRAHIAENPRFQCAHCRVGLCVICARVWPKFLQAEQPIPPRGDGGGPAAAAMARAPGAASSTKTSELFNDAEDRQHGPAAASMARVPGAASSTKTNELFNDFEDRQHVACKDKMHSLLMAAQFTRLLEKHSIRVCPTCGEGGVKDGACTHMHSDTCPDYCYVCGRDSRTLNGVDNSSHAPYGAEFVDDSSYCPMYLTHLLKIDSRIRTLGCGSDSCGTWDDTGDCPQPETCSEQRDAAASAILCEIRVRCYILDFVRTHGATAFHEMVERCGWKTVVDGNFFHNSFPWGSDVLPQWWEFEPEEVREFYSHRLRWFVLPEDLPGFVERAGPECDKCPAGYNGGGGAR